MRIIPKNSEAVLRARGLRLTGPRRVVLDVLRSTESHPTAEWGHRVVRRRLPRVSLGTVYRNLRLLVGEGLVAEIQGPHAASTPIWRRTTTSRVCAVAASWPSTAPWPSRTPRPFADGLPPAPGSPSRINASSSSAAVRSARPPRPGPAGRAGRPEFPAHPKEETPWQARASKAARVT